MAYSSSGGPHSHSQQVIPMEKKDLYDDEVFDRVVARISQLTPDTTPEWGKMTVGQMLAHVAEVQDVWNGKPLKGTPLYIRILGPLVKNKVLDLQPYARSIRTHPQYLMTDPEDFHTQRARLLDSLRAFHALGRQSFKHPIFGTLTTDERGWAAYKHLNHHLEQFGV